jgi:hypothetical protein
MYGYTVKVRVSDKGQKNLDKYGLGAKMSANKEKQAFYYKQIDALREGWLARLLEHEIKHFEADYGNTYITIVFAGDDDLKGLEKKIRTALSECLKLPSTRVDVKVGGFKQCKGCERPIFGDDHTRTDDGDPLCYSCMEQDESEPNATVRYSDGETVTIGAYHNGTGGDFKSVYHRTDAWRGHHDITPSKDWKLLRDDCILSMSEDEKELKEFDDHLVEALKQKEIRWARVITRTSNLFSSGYEFFVEAKRFEEVEGIVKHLASVYRDDARFALTAITGKDPSSASQGDYLLGAIGTTLLNADKKKDI